MGLIKRPHTITQEYELPEPPQQIAFWIPKGNWSHIKKRIKNLNYDTPIYQNLGSCLIGVGATSLFCAYTYPQPIAFASSFNYYFLWVVGLVCAIVGITCWTFDCSLKKIKLNETSEIIEEMEANEPRSDV